MYEPRPILYFLGLQEFLSPETNGGDSDQDAGQAADPAQSEQHLQEFHVSEECKQPRNIQTLPQQFQRKSYLTNCRPRTQQFNQEVLANEAEKLSISSPRHYTEADCYSRCEQYQPIPVCRRGITEFESCAQPIGLPISG